jgi:hypothetical protein
VLQGEADVERDHRGGEVLGRQRGLLTGGGEGPLDRPCAEAPVGAPESRGDLAELGVAARVSQDLEPEPEQPLPFGVALDRRQALARLAQGGPLGARRVLRHPAVDRVDAVV